MKKLLIDVLNSHVAVYCSCLLVALTLGLVIDARNAGLV
jgi:hypothetical protein